MTKPFALIIEDYEDQAMVFQKALDMAGYETEIILDGALGKKRLLEIAPDVVILDLHMPNISGKELLNQIRNDERLEKTRVILATADAVLADNLRKDADLVLLKPVSFAQLSILASRFRPKA